MKQPTKIGILGIGNLLLADEGFGIHCIERLQKEYVFPPTIELLDGGTAGIMLAPFMEDKDILFIIDVVNLKYEPGSIHCFSDQEVRSGNIQTRMSPHQVGLLEILDLCRLRGRTPDRVEMLTVVPADLSTRIGLTAPLITAQDRIIDTLLEKLTTLDIFPARQHGGQKILAPVH
jgi:hydrogenase maturation protease